MADLIGSVLGTRIGRVGMADESFCIAEIEWVVSIEEEPGRELENKVRNMIETVPNLHR